MVSSIPLYRLGKSSKDGQRLGLSPKGPPTKRPSPVVRLNQKYRPHHRLMDSFLRLSQPMGVRLSLLRKPSMCGFQEAILSNGTAVQELDWSVPRTDGLALRETDELLLLREMHHRHANTLMVLSCLLQHEFGLTTSPDLRASLERYEARIIAFGNLHRSLIIGAETEWVSVESYIEHLCKALAEALLKPLGIRCEVFADEGELPADRCERLGLVITELATNAAKYAFQGRNDGLVRVELINRSGSWLCIVSDDGVGTGIASFGAGSKILKQLVHTLGGDLAVKSTHNGTSAIVSWRA
jgi:two-component sensor histidine kinase